jgi:hypothetical protein
MICPYGIDAGGCALLFSFRTSTLSRRLDPSFDPLLVFKKAAAAVKSSKWYLKEDNDCQEIAFEESQLRCFCFCSLLLFSCMPVGLMKNSILQ